jgi:hypothetical protein
MLMKIITRIEACDSKGEDIIEGIANDIRQSGVTYFANYQ